jgi:hypothetical protein
MTTDLGRADEIIGRATELGLIEALLAGAGPGASGALLLAGEPGVGKSMMLDAAAVSASAHGYEVERAIGVEFDSEVSFGALSQMLNGFHDELDRIDAAYRGALRVILGLGGGPAPNPLLVGNAVLAVLERKAVRRPVLLVADDLQWFDPASLVTVLFVARRIMNGAVRFLGATRTGSGVDGEPGLPVHHVPALSEGSAVELVGSRFPWLKGPTQQRLLAGAQGNPLALIELAGTLKDGRRLPDHAEDDTPLSQRLRAIYAARILALPAATREVLLLAALHGAGEAAVLQAATGDGLAALAPAEQDRLISVEESSGRVVFNHPVVRSTVV